MMENTAGPPPLWETDRHLPDQCSYPEGYRRGSKHKKCKHRLGARQILVQVLALPFCSCVIFRQDLASFRRLCPLRDGGGPGERLWFTESV